MSKAKSALRQYDNNIVAGFHLRCAQGPLCEEPLRGVGFAVEEWKVDQQEETTIEETATISSAAGQVHFWCKCSAQPLSRAVQVITSAKDCCKLALQRQPLRLMVAMYSCVIQVTTDVLGKAYAVLSRRKGRVRQCGKCAVHYLQCMPALQVLGEEMTEGTNVFQISAVLPVIESFGFCEEIRMKTSGLASPQLVFSHWEVSGTPLLPAYVRYFHAIIDARAKEVRFFVESLLWRRLSHAN